MSEYDLVKNFSFKVDKIKNESYKVEGEMYVDKVVLETDNHQIPKGRVTINPTVKETKVEKVKQDGTVYENEIEDKRNPTVLELDSKFPKIKQLISAVNDKGSVKLKGMVRTVRDSPEDEWNFFIKADEMDNLKAMIPEDEETAEKISEDSDNSTSQDFVEDQTNIETDEDEENEKDEVIF